MTFVPDPLPPCPDRPNCVCSLAPEGPHAIAPLFYDGPPLSAREALENAVVRLPRTRITVFHPRRLNVECRSLIFRFVDDLLFVLDDKRKVIHVRSAARLGYFDFGVNRRRVERLRMLFAEEMARPR